VPQPLSAFVALSGLCLAQTISSRRAVKPMTQVGLHRPWDILLQGFFAAPGYSPLQTICGNKPLSFLLTSTCLAFLKPSTLCLLQCPLPLSCDRARDPPAVSPSGYCPASASPTVTGGCRSCLFLNRLAPVNRDFSGLFNSCGCLSLLAQFQP
jgi:hypothetical protein